MNYRKSFKATCGSLLILILILMPFNMESYSSQTDDDYRHYVSVRSFFEPYGARVTWDKENRTAIIEQDSHVIKLPAHALIAYIDNDTINLETSTQIINGKLVIAPLSLTMILRKIQPENISYTSDQLWNKTVAVHLKDKLWLDDNIYDADII